jgi:hypothetical protein
MLSLVMPSHVWSSVQKEAIKVSESKPQLSPGCVAKLLLQTGCGYEGEHKKESIQRQMLGQVNSNSSAKPTVGQLRR